MADIIYNTWDEEWISLENKAFNDGDVWAQLARAYASFFYTSYNANPSGPYYLYNLTTNPYPDPEDVTIGDESPIKKQVEFLTSVWATTIYIMKVQPFDRGDGKDWCWGVPGTEADPVQLALNSDFLNICTVDLALSILLGRATGDPIPRETWHGFITTLRNQFDQFEFIFALPAIKRVKVQMYSCYRDPVLDVYPFSISIAPPTNGVKILSTGNTYSVVRLSYDFLPPAGGARTDYSWGVLSVNLLQTSYCYPGQSFALATSRAGIEDTSLYCIGAGYVFSSGSGSPVYGGDWYTQPYLPVLPTAGSCNGGAVYYRYVFSSENFDPGDSIVVNNNGIPVGTITDSATVTIETESTIPNPTTTYHASSGFKHTIDSNASSLWDETYLQRVDYGIKYFLSQVSTGEVRGYTWSWTSSTSGTITFTGSL